MTAQRHPGWNGESATETRYYVLQAACKELSFYEKDAKRAEKKARRWVRLFWQAYLADLAKNCGGSIAHADAAGWYDRPPRVWLGSRAVIGGVVQCEQYTMHIDCTVAEVLA